MSVDSVPVKIVMRGTSTISLHERFSKVPAPVLQPIQQKVQIRPTSLEGVSFRGAKASASAAAALGSLYSDQPEPFDDIVDDVRPQRQMRSSLRNRMLARDMENRPAVMAALRLGGQRRQTVQQRLSARSRLGFGNNEFENAFRRRFPTARRFNPYRAAAPMRRFGTGGFRGGRRGRGRFSRNFAFERFRRTGEFPSRYPLRGAFGGTGLSRGGRGGGRARGTGPQAQGNRMPRVSQEELDAQLDAYMKKTKNSTLDDDLDAYMNQMAF